MNKIRLPEYLLLFLILVAAFALRLYKIDNPVADWHSWRQADTSSVSRNFIKNGSDLLHPRFDDLSNVPSGKENPDGYRMVEFPVYNFLQAEAAKNFPQKSLEWWGRMISILSSVGTLLFLYLIVKKYSGVRVAFFTAFFFAVLPYSIYYSRVILPEPMMVFTAVSSIYFFSRWLDGGKGSPYFYFISLFLTALTLLLKPFGIFLLLPQLFLVWKKWQLSFLKKPLLFLYLILAVVPFGLWRMWINQYPEGIPAYTWLFNDANIRFKGAFFRWLFGERIGKLILGYWGLPLLVLGLAKIEKHEGWFFRFWLLGALAYLFVIAGGNVRHDYYQILILPAIVIFLAKGADILLNSVSLNKITASILLVVCTAFMLSFSWYEVRGYYNINHPEIVEAGRAVDALVPANSKVIAPYMGDTAFLYQTNRKGWPVVTTSIPEMIKMGATHYISVNYDNDTKNLMAQYNEVKATKNYIILDLTSPK